MHIQHDYIIKFPFMDGIWGSGPVQVRSENSLRTTPEPHQTPKRFAVWPEGPNWTKFRFGVQRKLSPNRTALDRGIPRHDCWAQSNLGWHRLSRRPAHSTYLRQPWTSHGLHGSWVGRQQESLRIHGQLTSADVGDFHYFLGSADVGQKWRKVYTISCVLKVRRCTQCLRNKLQHFYICDFKSGHQIISLSI